MEGLVLNLFGNVYAGRRVLVTGHTGFKGSWLAMWLQALGAHVSGLALAPDTEPNHWSLLGLEGIDDHRVDLRDAAAVRQIVQTCQPEFIFHLAAQPLVRRSYRDPVATFDTNVMGLTHLLESVRTCPSVRVFINATTDKVYAEQPKAAGYREDDPLGGHDPYSSSKACAELVSACYRKSFFDTGGTGVRLATARAGNVIGGGDWAEDRLIPDLVRSCDAQQPVLLRNPAAVRPWQHVLEPLSGYLRLGQCLWQDQKLASAWNFGPDSNGEISVGNLVERAGRHWDAVRAVVDPTAHPHEAKVLRLDTSKAKSELGWHPVWDIDTTLSRTLTWYRRFHQEASVASSADLDAYIADARALGVKWAA